MKLCVALACVLVFADQSEGHKCSSLKNVKVKFVLKNHSDGIKTIDRCIEPEVFNRSQVSEVYVWNNAIPNMYPDTIKNMAHLTSASFYNCQTVDVSSRAFRNVPRLTHLSIERNNFSEIFFDVFNNLPSLKWLYLINNRIAQIADGAFANEALESVDLSKNRIPSWNKRWFSISSSLKSVTLDFNDIEAIEPEAFEGLSGLRVVALNYNKISTTKPNAFLGLKHLQTLGLQGNRLSTLDNRSFPNKMKFDYLFLNSNKLNYLPSDFMRRSRVKFLTADGNPWKCACWEEMRLWLNRNNATLLAPRSCRIYNVPTCMFPDVATSVCDESVDEELKRRFLDGLLSRNSASRDELSKCVCFE